MPPPQRSFVWCYFVKTDDNKYAVCQICNQKLKYFTSTGNLRSHIIRKHPIEYNREIGTDNTIINYVDVAEIEYSVKLEGEDPDTVDEKIEIVYEESNISDKYVTEPSTSTSQNICSAYEKGKINSKPHFTATSNDTQKRNLGCQLTVLDANSNQMTEAQQKQCDLALVKMIVKTFQPPLMVENSGFVEYSKALNSLYKIPTQQILTESLLKNLYLEETARLKSIFKEVKYISLSISIWQCNNNNVSFTAHFVHKNILHLRILSTNEIKSEQHTEKNLALQIRKLLNEYDINDNQIVAIVSDAGVNVKQAVTEHLQKPYHQCTKHTLDFIAKELLNGNDPLKKIILKCNNLTRYFKNSALAIGKLEKLGTPFTIKQTEETKWNTILLMFEKFLEIKNTLTVASSKLPLEPESLNSSEWKIISDCVSILKPLEQMTTELLNEKYITMASVIPLLRGLQFAVTNTISVSEIGSWLKNELLETVSKRLGNPETNKIISKSTFLDPRYKEAAFGLEENARNCQNWIIDELEAITTYSINDSNTRKQESDEPNADEGNLSLWDHFDNKLKNLQRTEIPTTKSAICLRQFLELPYCGRKSDPMEFWSKHQLLMPELYDLHQKYACVPATSVLTERIFSKTGKFRLANLTSSSNYVNMILFLNSCFL